MSENNFNGKVVLVSGAGRGAGRMLAQAFAASGAIIAASDISPINVEAVVAGIKNAGGRAGAYIHDIAKKVDVQAMVNQVVDEYSRIDILVNSANVQPPAGLLELDEWDLHRVFEVNAIGTLLMMQSVGRVMRAQGGGIIVNIIQIPDEAPASFIASRAGLAAPGAIERFQQELGNISVFTVSADDPVADVLAMCLR